LPGPFPLPFTGNLFGIIYHAGGDRFKWIKLQNEKHGDLFEIYIESYRRIVLARADYVEKLMLSTKKSNYIKKAAKDPSAFHEIGIANKGIIFNNHIPTWRFNRQFLTQAILTPSFSKEASCWTLIIFKELNGYWKEIGDDEPINFAIWIHKFTTEIIFQLIVGIKVNALVRCYNDNVEPSRMKHVQPNPIDKEIENFAELVDNELSCYDFALTYPALLRHTILKKRNNELCEKRNRTVELVRKVIDHRRNEIEQTPVHEELRQDMLTSLITANTEREINKHQHNDDKEFIKPLTNDQISQILLESITGGIDTTANLMCYVVYYLCHHPDVLDRLRQELDSIFGFDQNLQITIEDLSNMNYTEAIIKECF
jgi:cytochrome P450